MSSEEKQRHHIAVSINKSAKHISPSLCVLLMGTLVAGGLMFFQPVVAHAQVVPTDPQCSISGKVVTCSGNVTEGVHVDDPAYNTLIIDNVDAPGITPSMGRDAVSFTSSIDDDININVDTGNFSITTAGIFWTKGINAQLNGNGNITTKSTGGINVEVKAGAGIYSEVKGDGNISTTSTGNINTSGSESRGIYSKVDGAGNISINSLGNIKTTGLNAIGIDGYIYGYGNINIISTGNIETVANNATGISLSNRHGGNIITTSNGNISTKGGAASGIRVGLVGMGDVITASNGDIITEGYNSKGILNTIYGNGNISTTSVGNILTTKSFSAGILDDVSGDGNVSITSTGNITSLLAAGIQADADGIGEININTSGTVNGLTGIVVEFRVLNAPTTINNSATITGTGGTAIDLRNDGNDTLNLFAGSAIIGTVDFGNGNNNMGGTNANDIDTLSAFAGVNTVINFADTGSQGDTNLQSTPEIVSSNIAVINGGLTAVAIDRSGFAASQLFISNLTNSIFNSINNSTPAPQIDDRSTETINGVSENAWTTPKESSTGRNSWISGFAGAQNVEATTSHTDLDHNIAGFVVGTEKEIDTGILGFLSGYSVGDVDLGSGAGSTNANFIFGGAYLIQDYGTHRINLAFVGGKADYEFTRNISGTVPTTATGNSDGWFTSPSATIAVPVTTLPIPAVASLRAGYTSLFLDGYTEAGTVANPLKVASRDIHQFNARAQITLPRTSSKEDGSHPNVELRFGLDGQWDMGSDNVGVYVGSTSIRFDANLEDQVAGFVGASTTYNNPDKNLTLTLSGELKSNFNGGLTTVGEIKLIKRF